MGKRSEIVVTPATSEADGFIAAGRGYAGQRDVPAWTAWADAWRRAPADVNSAKDEWPRHDMSISARETGHRRNGTWRGAKKLVGVGRHLDARRSALGAERHPVSRVQARPDHRGRREKRNVRKVY